VLQGADIPWAELFGYLDLQADCGAVAVPQAKGRRRTEAFLAEKVYPLLEQWKQRLLRNICCPK